MKQRTNNQFYNDLVEGKELNKLLQKRFSYDTVIKNPSLEKYLLPFLKRQIKSSDIVLDYGCGSGILLPIISKFCTEGEVHGFDVVPSLVELAKDLIAKKNIENAYAYIDKEFNDVFRENCFDVIIFNDVLHHVENPIDTINNVHRLLKPEGKLIINEPNILNPAIFIFQLCDPNERKWLKMGYFKYYEDICKQKFKIVEKDWFPLVYGPSSKLVLTIAEICDKFPLKLLRWGSPRIYLVGEVIK